MSDTATQTDAPTADDAPKTGRQWEGEYDEEKAKRLVDNLDAEIASLKAANKELAAQRDDFKAAAEKTGEDRDKDLAAAIKRAEDAERKLAISKHNLPDDVVEEFADFLTGTPEEVDAKAARLAARLAPSAPSSDDPAGDETDETGDTDHGTDKAPAAPPMRPRPDLTPTPGHGGDEPTSVDTAEIARSTRRRGAY